MNRVARLVKFSPVNFSAGTMFLVVALVVSPFLAMMSHDLRLYIVSSVLSAFFLLYAFYYFYCSFFEIILRFFGNQQFVEKINFIYTKVLECEKELAVIDKDHYVVSADVDGNLIFEICNDEEINVIIISTEKFNGLVTFKTIDKRINHRTEAKILCAENLSLKQKALLINTVEKLENYFRQT